MTMINRYDIVGAFRDVATAKGWHFIYGYNDYINADFHHYDVDEVVLVCEMTLQPILENQGGAVASVNFSGIVMLGRKFDSIYENQIPEGETDPVPVLVGQTEANLDESMLQKHDRRLAELWELLTDELSNMACEDGYTISLSNGVPLINFTQHNIDFVKYNISMEG